MASMPVSFDHSFVHDHEDLGRHHDQSRTEDLNIIMSVWVHLLGVSLWTCQLAVLNIIMSFEVQCRVYDIMSLTFV